MNLKQLKSMIAEEYKYWLAEQPIDAPGMPGVEVGPNDVDAMGGGDDSEATLRQIYDMLKSYFEGGAGAGEAMPVGGADGADMGDMDAAAMGDDDDMGDDDMDDKGDEEEDDDAKKESKKSKEDKEDKKELKERFQKLANIIKG